MTVTAVQAGVEAPAVGPVVTEPGVYQMTADEYHADPVPGGSLSSTGARKLLPPSCPALFRYEQDHGRAPKKTFDLGHAAHKLVLGDGPDIEVVEGARWDTTVAKSQVAEIRARGGIPLKQHEYEQVQAMADALRQHPVASALFDPARGGKPEQALFWRDPQTGVMCRALLDWLPPHIDGRRLIIPDYKTTNDASPEAVQKSVASYGYNQQDAWYRMGVEALGLGGRDTVFVFVFQEKTAPYLVTVVELDAVARRIGAAKNRVALHTYRECVETGRWPGYRDDIALLPLPAWAEKRDEEEYLG
ncbi:PDDEXK-like uncharacterized protein DUF3799 [Streptomyces sp. Amel2xB2]|uniref:PD-(D/E)XK nuclease-like domain-containing protein n=1 Tax=Streptomyces sp. Amel2xB2 TaxID=1305829 RepID=UPI000DB97A99|nr:PD-(D/E)XK nuclease-like domain-containing protein [Streptomyces sp. Amel2xB2]RAJ70208.1 PDDEXK-like uncharacterized protein DUF3799 [Streptomyces sp. Amel2xB2]